MSKLSVHVNQSPTGLGTLLQQTYNARSPIGIIYAVNINIKSDILKYSPTTKLIYRRQTDQFNRQPDGFFEGDPVASCEAWFGTPDPADNNRTLFQNWELNPADWYDPLNEVVPDTKDKAIWLNAWYVHALSISTPRGFKLALCSTPTATPPIEMYQYLVPCLQVGKTSGAILNLHAYWGEGVHGSPEWIESFKQNALRYRQVWNVLPESARLPMLYSEASPGNGYDSRDTETGSRWIANMIDLDRELMEDDYMLGACGYQLGGDESNLKNIVQPYADYIASHPTVIVTPPPAALKHYLTATVAKLDIYTLPDPSSVIVGSLAKGAALEVKAQPVIAKGYEWHEIVQAPYTRYYVARERLAEVYARMESR